MSDKAQLKICHEHCVLTCTYMNQQYTCETECTDRYTVDMVFASLYSVPAFLRRVSEFRYM